MVYQSEDLKADAEVTRSNIESTSQVVEAEVVTEMIAPPPVENEDVVVEQIVNKWNELVTVVQNTTIGLCLMIKGLTKDYPDDTVKDILKKVRSHPNIKKFVSIDRIWQGMRLINKRPDLIEYNNMPEEKKQLIPDRDKPYLKKDGEIFWEFYFELAKQPLSDGAITMLEVEGKDNKWSFRELREKIQECKDELSHPGAFENRKVEKQELIKKIAGICKALPVERLRGVLTLCEDFQKEDREEK